eukprot:TRINITY_DN4122_c0_g1_i1.p1 TRINITY_DN4122_c0_g1~~TRINITY_DN4122_c0_g1_i1.p1  ORF type:complete len:425 (-),score=132.22 TRINITY_DN4122_c0_g1_i1:104-1378(-)
MTTHIEQPRLQAAVGALKVTLPKSKSTQDFQPENGVAASDGHREGGDESASRASKMARLVRRDSGLIQDRTKRSTRYPAVIIGCELVDWFVSSGASNARLDAVRLGQSLVDENLLHHVYLDLPFQDGPEFYRFRDDEDPATLSCAIALRSCSKAGMLSVKGALGWHQRFCLVNSDNHLFYIYESDSSFHPKHVVDLSSTDTTVDDCLDARHHGSRCLTLASPTAGSHVYASDSDEHTDDWIRSLVLAGAKYKNEDKLLHVAKSIFEFAATDIDGQEVSLERYRGRVCLIVNVASACGLTHENYKQLEQLYARHKESGFEILAFPCNQFGSQEPDTCARIKAFAAERYHVGFTLFDKVHVNGKDAHPLFKFLRHSLTGVLTNAVKWNFTKFLCDRNGHPYKRYGPPTGPLSCEDDIIKLLNQKAA